MVNKLDEIHGTISINSCDVTVITETWLTSNVTDDLISIPGFKHVRRDRPGDQRGGGLCTFLANNIDFLYLQNLDDLNFETQWFLLKLNRLPRGINSIILATVYHPPKNDDYLLRNHIFQCLDATLSTYPNSGIILMGDFNQFKPGNLCSSFRLKKLVSSPTRGLNTLDQVYSSLANYYQDAEILPPIGMSDHSSILLQPTLKAATIHPSTRVLKRLSRLSNKQALSSSLSHTNWYPLFCATSTQDKFNIFSNILSDNMDTHLPLRSVKHNPVDKPWINHDIKDAITKRQHAWVKGNNTKYIVYRNKVRKLCRRARRSFYNSMIKHTQDTNPKKWWHNIKLLAGLSKSQPLTSILHNGQTLREKDLAEHIADSFCNIVEDIAPLDFSPPQVLSVPDEYIISPAQVSIALSNIKVQKAIGPDEIPNWLLKTNAESLSAPISSIFNASISQATLPSLWKSADVIPLPKIKSSQLTDQDLRPISLTPTLSKIFEGFVFNWMSEQISPHIDPNQYGNVKKCSTTHALIHLMHHWLFSTDSPGSVIRACMIDFSRAFDRIDHSILVRKLQLLNVHPLLINWCADFLRDRYLRVKLGSFKSSWKLIHAGVPQGTKLGPLLFLVMINDLTTRFPMYKYVDDCTIYEVASVPYASQLQNDLDDIDNWTEANNMRINVKKTKELRVSFLKEVPSFNDLSAKNNTVDVVSQFKLLGVIISSDLTWNLHIDYICSKASKRLYSIRILKRSGISIYDLAQIYSTFVRPILEYACQVWHFSLTEKLSNQIEQIQKRAVKIALPNLSSYSERLEFLKLDTLADRRQQLCHKLYKSIVIDDTNKLNKLLPVPTNHPYSLRTPRTFPLFKCNTDRFYKSFICQASKLWDSCTQD